MLGLREAGEISVSACLLQSCGSNNSMGHARPHSENNKCWRKVFREDFINNLLVLNQYLVLEQLLSTIIEFNSNLYQHELQ